MVIVDNSVYSFAYQLDNGIPIIPFYNDPKDEELMHLIFYIQSLVNVDDVREANRKAFELYLLGTDDLNEA
jgi:CTD small phosphatase-like protein 2